MQLTAALASALILNLIAIGGAQAENVCVPETKTNWFTLGKLVPEKTINNPFTLSGIENSLKLMCPPNKDGVKFNLVTILRTPDTNRISAIMGMTDTNLETPPPELVKALNTRYGANTYVTWENYGKYRTMRWLVNGETRAALLKKGESNWNLVEGAVSEQMAEVALKVETDFLGKMANNAAMAQLYVDTLTREEESAPPVELGKTGLIIEAWPESSNPDLFENQVTQKNLEILVQENDSDETTDYVVKLPNYSPNVLDHEYINTYSKEGALLCVTERYTIKRGRLDYLNLVIAPILKKAPPFIRRSVRTEQNKYYDIKEWDLKDSTAQIKVLNDSAEISLELAECFK